MLLEGMGQALKYSAQHERANCDHDMGPTPSTDAKSAFTRLPWIYWTQFYLALPEEERVSLPDDIGPYVDALVGHALKKNWRIPRSARGGCRPSTCGEPRG
jgi:hypothetical protein